VASRTIAIRVAEVLEGGTKSGFYSDLRESLDFCRLIANRAATECVRQDDLLSSKCPKLYTYPAVKSMSPAGVSNVVSSVCRAVEKAYKSDRWNVRCGRRAVRSYRSQPLPLLHNESSKMFSLEDRGEFLVARLKLIGGWWTVRIAGGSNYRDQIAGLRASIADNTYGDSKVWVDRKHRAVIGVSVEREANKQKESIGTMVVSSSRDSLLVATLPRSDVPFVINADVVHRWQSESDRLQYRLRQDRKSGANRRAIREESNRMSTKMENRMSTLCHEVAARVIERATRSKVSSIRLDLTVKSFAKHFPWYELASKIKYKAEDAGIDVTDSTAIVLEPDVNKPHVYFKYSQSTGRVKIGRTGRNDGGRHGAETDSPEELVVLAVDNQPKTKLVSKEKHYHAMFAEHRVKGEWFACEPVMAWLREVKWLGNSGNLSQIAQVLDVSEDAFRVGHLKANSECSPILSGCSQNADKKLGYRESNRAALAATE
jgi:hypothetical protein